MTAKATTLIIEAQVLTPDQRLREHLGPPFSDPVAPTNGVLSELSEMGLAMTECALQLRRLRDDVGQLAALRAYVVNLARLYRIGCERADGCQR